MPTPQLISGKQVNLLLALFNQAEIYSTKYQLEWIEDAFDIEVTKLEDLNTGQIQMIVNRLKKQFNLS